MLNMSTSYKYWVLHHNIFDHFPIVLQLDVNPQNFYRPFKFDHLWLKNDDLCLMVKIFLENFENSRNTNVMEHFCFKLKELKKEVVFWTKNKLIENRATLKQTEVEIVDILLSNYTGNVSNDVLKKLASLQLIQDEILLKNEEKVSLKSRATWLEASDRNTNLFYNFASFRRNLNAIGRFMMKMV